MNFLSHFYFDRHTGDPDLAIGIVLPDLVKNARKEWCLRPEKQPQLFAENEHLASIFKGWLRHLEVDKHFHSSEFFRTHTGELRRLLAPALEKSPARPSFVAHIALELMLDGLLIREGILDPDAFYEQLENVDRQALTRFLEANGADDTTVFFDFLDEFISARYLHNYRETQQIIYAVHRICMRVWIDPFTETQKLQLAAILSEYQKPLKKDFMHIFNTIDRLVN
jgi:hypothetical protein